MELIDIAWDCSFFSYSAQAEHVHSDAGIRHDTGHLFNITSGLYQSAINYRLYEVILNSWKVETTARFATWLQAQDDAMIEDVLASLAVLREFGPTLGRPDVDTLVGSRFSNMKELRVQSNGRAIRAFFAFDPVRRAIVLCAGNKTGTHQRRFYQAMIKLADREYQQHLEEMNHAKT